MIQIMQSSFYSNLGKQQYNITITMQPERAPIYDRTGEKFLAINKDTLSAFILPKQVKSQEILVQFLEKHFPEKIKILEKSKNKHFMFIQRKLTDKQIEIIKKSNIADIHLLKEQSRFYPIESTSTIVGITDIDNNGLSGLELKYNKKLSGKPTTFFLEKDARSGHFYFKKETKVRGKIAEPITVTIDSNLQFLVAQELKESITQYNAKEGAVLVINPENGDITAIANYPYFDPNNTQSFSSQNCHNKAITQVYELGSVIKVFAALAAIEEEVVTKDEIIDCKNKKTTYIDGRKINTVKAHGKITFSEVVEKSNNIGIAIIAKRVGEKLYDHYKKIGFGEKTTIGFPAEPRGFVNPPHKWSKQSIISLSYGYEISATLLQLARAFCMIAQDGMPVYPRLVFEKNETKQKEQFSTPLYSKKSIDTIKKILENTTLKGTARKARIKGYDVMCKTGTANLLVNGTYSQDDNIFTCAGIVQKDNYKRVIVTFVKEVEPSYTKSGIKRKVYAQSVAVPLFEKVAKKTLIHDKIM